MNTIIKNYSINLVYQIILIIFPVILIPYISRVLGPNASGEYAYVYTYSLYFIMVGQLGISLYGAKQISLNRDDKISTSNTFWKLIYAKIITTSISIFAYLILLIISRQTNMLFYIQVILLISTFFDISWFYVGMEDFKPLLLRNLAIKTISLTLIIIFVKKPEDVYLYAIITFLTESIGQLLMWFKLNNRILRFNSESFQIRDLRINLKGMFILFIPQIIIQVYSILNNTMLGIFSSKEQVAYYDYATKILNIALTVITSLGIVMLPRIANMNKNNDYDEIKKYINLSVKMMSIIGIPIMVSIMTLSDIFVEVYLGDMYKEVGILLTIYALKIFLVIYSNIMGMQYLVPSGRNSSFIASVLIGAITSIIINIFLIADYGAYGVVISVIIAELLVTVTQFVFTRRNLNIYKSLLSTHKMIVSGLFMYMIMIFSKNVFTPQLHKIVFVREYGIIFSSIVDIVISTSFGLIVYVSVLFLMRDDTSIEIYTFIRNKYLGMKRR